MGNTGVTITPFRCPPNPLEEGMPENMRPPKATGVGGLHRLGVGRTQLSILQGPG